MPAFLICHAVEKVNYVAAKSIFGAAAFVEIEWAGGIDFQFGRVSQNSTEFALEVERSLAHLRHGESDNMEGHRSRPSIAEDARSVQCLTYLQESNLKTTMRVLQSTLEAPPCFLL
jgi:hypothetical protein